MNKEKEAKRRIKEFKSKITKNLTIRQEANALVYCAFRNGFIEDLHAGRTLPEKYSDEKYSKISEEEMKKLMIESSARIAKLLKFKEKDLENYKLFISLEHGLCSDWEEIAEEYKITKDK